MDKQILEKLIEVNGFKRIFEEVEGLNIEDFYEYVKEPCRIKNLTDEFFKSIFPTLIEEFANTLPLPESERLKIVAFVTNEEIKRNSSTSEKIIYDTLTQLSCRAGEEMAYACEIAYLCAKEGADEELGDIFESDYDVEIFSEFCYEGACKFLKSSYPDVSQFLNEKADEIIEKIVNNHIEDFIKKALSKENFWEKAKARIPTLEETDFPKFLGFLITKIKEGSYPLPEQTCSVLYFRSWLREKEYLILEDFGAEVLNLSKSATTKLLIANIASQIEEAYERGWDLNVEELLTTYFGKEE